MSRSTPSTPATSAAAFPAGVERHRQRRRSASARWRWPTRKGAPSRRISSRSACASSATKSSRTPGPARRRATFLWSIAPLHVPATWMPKARFDHDKHATFKCADCHEAVAKSKSQQRCLASRHRVVPPLPRRQRAGREQGRVDLRLVPWLPRARPSAVEPGTAWRSARMQGARDHDPRIPDARHEASPSRMALATWLAFALLAGCGGGGGGGSGSRRMQRRLPGGLARRADGGRRAAGRSRRRCSRRRRATPRRPSPSSTASATCSACSG